MPSELGSSRAVADIWVNALFGPVSNHTASLVPQFSGAYQPIETPPDRFEGRFCSFFFEARGKGASSSR